MLIFYDQINRSSTVEALPYILFYTKSYGKYTEGGHTAVLCIPICIAYGIVCLNSKLNVVVCYSKYNPFG